MTDYLKEVPAPPDDPSETEDIRSHLEETVAKPQESVDESGLIAPRRPGGQGDKVVPLNEAKADTVAHAPSEDDTRPHTPEKETPQTRMLNPRKPSTPQRP